LGENLRPGTFGIHNRFMRRSGNNTCATTPMRPMVDRRTYRK
jgi:hypothetical protein